MAEYWALSHRVYKGRPLKIDNYPRFRGLFEKLDDAEEWLEFLLEPKTAGEFDHLFLKQAQLLERYEAQALARRKRAVAAFDQVRAVRGKEIS